MYYFTISWLKIVVSKFVVQTSCWTMLILPLNPTLLIVLIWIRNTNTVNYLLLLLSTIFLFSRRPLSWMDQGESWRDFQSCTHQNGKLHPNFEEDTVTIHFSQSVHTFLLFFFCSCADKHRSNIFISLWNSDVSLPNKQSWEKGTWLLLRNFKVGVSIIPLTLESSILGQLLELVQWRKLQEQKDWNKEDS